MADLPDSLPCKYKVGFLFKKICGRFSREGCKYCKGMPLPPGTRLTEPDYDPYYRDRTLYYNNDYYRTHEFTHYDARGLVKEQDTNYETDLDAS